jgi:hypothetical protein
MDGSPELVFALAGLFRFFFSRAKVPLAREVADQVLHLAEAHDRCCSRSGTAWGPLLSLGEFATAREHLEQAIALYDMEQHRSIATRHADDPALTALHSSPSLWFSATLTRRWNEVAGEALASKLALRTASPFARASRSGCTCVAARPRRLGASEALIGSPPSRLHVFVDEATSSRRDRGAGDPEADRADPAGLAAHRAAGSRWAGPRTSRSPRRMRGLASSTRGSV